MLTARKLRAAALTGKELVLPRQFKVQSSHTADAGCLTGDGFRRGAGHLGGVESVVRDNETRLDRYPERWGLVLEVCLPQVLGFLALLLATSAWVGTFPVGQRLVADYLMINSTHSRLPGRKQSHDTLAVVSASAVFGPFLGLQLLICASARPPAAI